MLHMPDRAYDAALPVPSIWDWSPVVIGLLALVALVGYPLLSSWAGGRLSYPTPDGLRALLSDVLLAFAFGALVFVAQDTGPAERSWYTSITWHVICLVIGLGVVLAVKHVAARRGKPLPRNPYSGEKYAIAVYAVIASCILAAVPTIFNGIFTQDFLVVIYVATLVGFFLFPWGFPRLLQWANQAPELEERVEGRVANAWARVHS